MIARSADLDLLIKFETCWDHCSLESKVTSKTFMLGPVLMSIPPYWRPLFAPGQWFDHPCYKKSINTNWSQKTKKFFKKFLYMTPEPYFVEHCPIIQGDYNGCCLCTMTYYYVCDCCHDVRSGLTGRSRMTYNGFSTNPPSPNQ